MSSYYRVYLLGPDAGIRAGEFFVAADDTAATEIATALYQSCSDVFADYELWQGTKCVAPGGPKWKPKVNVEQIVHARQDNIMDLEDRLQHGFTCVNRSRKLLEVSAQLRERRQPIFETKTSGALPPPDLESSPGSSPERAASGGGRSDRVERATPR